MLLSFGEKTFHHIHCTCHKKNRQLFHNVVSLLPRLRLVAQTSTYCIKCVHTQLLNPTQHTKHYPLPSDLETSKLPFPGQVLAKNVHVPSQTVRTCMKIPCTHGAPFSSLLFRNGSCLPLQNILGLEVDGMDQAAAYCTGRSTPSCAHETANACVREHSTLPRRLSLPRSHRYDVPEVEFKKLRIQSSRPSETFACPA